MGVASSTYEKLERRALLFTPLRFRPRRSDFCAMKIGAAPTKIGAAWTKIGAALTKKSARH